MDTIIMAAGGKGEKPPSAGRILIVLHDFSGGGTERVAIRLANCWARAGRVVRIFCGEERGPLRTLVDPMVLVERAYPPLPRAPLSRVRLGWALARAAQGFAPDIVFAPGNFHLLVLAAFATRDRSGIPTVCKISNPLVRNDRRGVLGLIRRVTLTLLTRQVARLVAMSPALAAEAASVLGNDLVATRWEPIFEAEVPQAHGSEREAGLIVGAGRLEPQKHWDMAIAAMAHLSRWTEARLVILGEGRERARLQSMIERLGLEQRVQLRGHVGDVKPWLRRASCFVMTSHYEGYPASLVEALACGAPAVVTPCSPALPEILTHAPAALIVEPDPGAIADTLQRVLQRSQPYQGAPELSARHNEQSAAAAYLALLDECVIDAKAPGI